LHTRKCSPEPNYHNHKQKKIFTNPLLRFKQRRKCSKSADFAPAAFSGVQALMGHLGRRKKAGATFLLKAAPARSWFRFLGRA
jgi:hypothetical protein